MTITIFKKASGVKRAIAAVLAATTLVSVAACGSNNNSLASSDTLNASKGKTTKITVGVCPGPYGDMVDKVIAPLLKDDGFELKTKLFNDYVQPDKALASGSIQANLMQHINYLNKFTKDNNLDLTLVGTGPDAGSRHLFEEIQVHQRHQGRFHRFHCGRWLQPRALPWRT